MPDFGDQVQTTEAPTLPSDILVGHGHTTRDFEYAGPLTLAVGDVVGWERSTGRMAPLETDTHTKTLSGDGSEKTFDLDHDSVDEDTLEAWNSDGQRLAATVSRGTGSDGVDQIEFDVAPAEGDVNVRYQRTTATPAGVSIAEAELEDGDEITLGTVIEGSVDYDYVQGLPDDMARGTQIGALRFV